MQESAWVCITVLLSVGLLASLAAHCYRGPLVSAVDIEQAEVGRKKKNKRDKSRRQGRVVPAIVTTSGYTKDAPLLGSAGNSSGEIQYVSSPSTATIVSTNRPVPAKSATDLNKSGLSMSGFSMTFHQENTLDEHTTSSESSGSCSDSAYGQRRGVSAPTLNESGSSVLSDGVKQ